VTLSRTNPAYGFLAPALAAIAVFFVVPVVASVLLSVTDFDIYAIASVANLRFVGYGNYVHLLRDPLFWVGLKNTAYFVFVAGPLSIAVSLAAAVALNAKLVRFKAVFRTIFFLPVITTLVAVAVVWRYLYHPRFGLLNYGLSFLGLGPIDWLGNSAWAMPAIILLAVWKNFGFNMVIFIAGLQSIPDRLYEVASLDGAGARRQFWHVTLPMLAPTFAFVTIITLIGYFQLFAEPYVMTQGGPEQSTLSIVLFMYQEGFRWWNMGYAAAVACVLFAIIFVLTLVSLRLRGGAPMGVAEPEREPVR
jgi:multiple sugar transport system permease protein